MTKRDRFLLTLIVPVLVLGGVWFLLLSPQRKEAERLDTELAAEQQRLSTAQGDLIRFQAARDELDRAMADLASAGKAVPADTAVPALLRQLEGSAERSGVEMEAITTSTGSVPLAAPTAAPAEATAEDPAAAAAAPAATPSATSVELTLTFRGSYFALERLFSRLDRVVDVSRRRVEATGRLLSVRDLQLAQRQGELVAQVQASVYVLPTLASLLPAVPDAAVPDGAPPVTDAASVPAPTLATATPATP